MLGWSWKNDSPHVEIKWRAVLEMLLASTHSVHTPQNERKRVIEKERENERTGPIGERKRESAGGLGCWPAETESSRGKRKSLRGLWPTERERKRVRDIRHTWGWGAASLQIWSSAVHCAWWVLCDCVPFVFFYD